jgi:hypothetical protein
MNALDNGLVEAWLDCTFVYMIQAGSAHFRLQFGHVTPQLTIWLGDERVVTKNEMTLLMRMHSRTGDSIVFAPEWNLEEESDDACRTE